MAEKQAGELSLRIGLTLGQLQSDFLAADKTKILEVQERSLTQLFEMQRDKLTLATKAYREYTDSKGANATVTKNLETAMERERLAVARLEAQLKSLSTQKISLDTTQIQENISRPNSNIQNVKIKAEIDTSKLQGATAAFDAQKIHISDLTKELESVEEDDENHEDCEEQ